MISRFGFSQARCSGVLPASVCKYLRQGGNTFIVSQVFPCAEVEAVLGQHSQDLQLVVGCCHVGRGIEGLF